MGIPCREIVTLAASPTIGEFPSNKRSREMRHGLKTLQKLMTLVLFCALCPIWAVSVLLGDHMALSEPLGIEPYATNGTMGISIFDNHLSPIYSITTTPTVPGSVSRHSMTTSTISPSASKDIVPSPESSTTDSVIHTPIESSSFDSWWSNSWDTFRSRYAGLCPMTVAVSVVASGMAFLLHAFDREELLVNSILSTILGMIFVTANLNIHVGILAPAISFSAYLNGIYLWRHVFDKVDPGSVKGGDNSGMQSTRDSQRLPKVRPFPLTGPIVGAGILWRAVAFGFLITFGIKYFLEVNADINWLILGTLAILLMSPLLSFLWVAAINTGIARRMENVAKRFKSGEFDEKLSSFLGFVGGCICYMINQWSFAIAARSSDETYRKGMVDDRGFPDDYCDGERTAKPNLRKRPTNNRHKTPAI